jgi:hypothetical protein
VRSLCRGDVAPCSQLSILAIHSYLNCRRTVRSRSNNKANAVPIHLLCCESVDLYPPLSLIVGILDFLLCAQHFHDTTMKYDASQSVVRGI